ncbi:MAG: hypothetical protein QM698_11360 [Micropepsaceae bacterium]
MPIDLHIAFEPALAMPLPTGSGDPIKLDRGPSGFIEKPMLWIAYKARATVGGAAKTYLAFVLIAPATGLGENYIDDASGADWRVVPGGPPITKCTSDPSRGIGFSKQWNCRTDFIVDGRVSVTVVTSAQYAAARPELISVVANAILQWLADV